MEFDKVGRYDDTKYSSIEENHTHCLLFDEAKMDRYLSDRQRDDLIKEAQKKQREICNLSKNLSYMFYLIPTLDSLSNLEF